MEVGGAGLEAGGWEGRLGSRDFLVEPRAREGGSSRGRKGLHMGRKEGSARAQDTLEDHPEPGPPTSLTENLLGELSLQSVCARGSWCGAVGSERGLMAPGQPATLLPGTWAWFTHLPVR